MFVKWSRIIKTNFIKFTVTLRELPMGKARTLFTEMYERMKFLVCIIKIE